MGYNYTPKPRNQTPPPPKSPKSPKPPKPPKPKSPFDEQDTNDAAGKSTKINPKTGMAEGWGGGAPRKGSSKKKWYGTGP